MSQAQYLLAASFVEPRDAGTEALAHAEYLLGLPWCHARVYRAVESDAPATVLYDIWLVDDDHGLVFVADRRTPTGVVYRCEREFVVADDFDDLDGAAGRLAIALNDAERVEVADAALIFARDASGHRSLVGFTSEADVPTSPDAWDALFARGYPRVSEAFVRHHGAGFGPDAWRHVWQSEPRSEAFIRDFAHTPVAWELISFRVPEQFVRDNPDRVIWSSVCAGLSEAFVREFADRLNWAVLARHSQFSEEFIREFQDRIDWKSVSRFQRISEPFIEEFAHRISFHELSYNEQPRSVGFLRRHADKLHWGYLCRVAPNLAALIAAFPDRIDWGALSCRRLPTELITAYAQRLTWSALSWSLTEEQVHLFEDRVDWVALSRQYNAPWVEPFLRAHADDIDDYAWEKILAEGQVSTGFKNEIRARRARRRELGLLVTTQ